MGYKIWHNPACGTSRRVLELIRAAGLAPEVVDYLKTPPDRAELEAVVLALGQGARHLLREKSLPAVLPDADPASLSEGEIMEAMLAHPQLINRPVVFSPKGVRLCRPAEEVLALLPGLPDTAA